MRSYVGNQNAGLPANRHGWVSAGAVFLFFKSRYALDIKLFFLGGQFLPSCRLLWLLLGERGPPLKKTDIVTLSYTLKPP